MEPKHRNDYWPIDDGPSFPNFPFPGQVRLIIESAPWQFALLLHGLEISKSTVKASIDRKRFERYFTFDDMPQLFRIEGQYLIQLEADSEHLPIVSLHAELARRELSVSGITLSFNFLRNTSELDELMQHLQSTK